MQTTQTLQHEHSFVWNGFALKTTSHNYCIVCVTYDTNTWNIIFQEWTWSGYSSTHYMQLKIQNPSNTSLGFLETLVLLRCMPRPNTLDCRQEANVHAVDRVKRKDSSLLSLMQRGYCTIKRIRVIKWGDLLLPSSSSSSLSTWSSCCWSDS